MRQAAAICSLSEVAVSVATWHIHVEMHAGACALTLATTNDRRGPVRGGRKRSPIRMRLMKMMQDRGDAQGCVYRIFECRSEAVLVSEDPSNYCRLQIYFHNHLVCRTACKVQQVANSNLTLGSSINSSSIPASMKQLASEYADILHLWKRRSQLCLESVFASNVKTIKTIVRAFSERGGSVTFLYP